MKELLTTQEAAKILKVNPRTVQRRIKEGKIKSCKIEGARRIDPDDLQAYIDNEKEKTN